MTSQQFPLVSVLMTAYNREKYIAEAIESVLASTYENFELIIVDDRSSDSTVEIAKKYEQQDSRVHVYVNEKNLGDYPNRNKAAEYAKGKYIKYLDADDVIYYYGLEVMINCMEQYPQAGFGLGSKPDDETPMPVLLTSKKAYEENFDGFGHFDRAPGSSIIKLDAFNLVQGFSGKRMIGDYELWFKMARYFPMVKFSLDLYWNRLHSEQESRSEYAKMYSQLRMQVLEEALDHPDCPLSRDEIEIIKKKSRIRNIKESFLGLKKKFKF